MSSSNPSVAAHVALGIASAEASRRRVVVGDLVGDLAPLASLITDDDPHGISDSILYGVSITRIGRPVAGTENLFVMPSGTEQVMSEDIFASGRWKQIAEGFTKVGALLLLVARSDSPGLGVLADQLDGVVVVRDSELPAAPGALILARVASPTRTLKVPFLRDVEIPRFGSARRWLTPSTVALAIMIVVASVFALLRVRDNRESQTLTDTPAVAGGPTVADSFFVAPPANVAESAAASAFAVELLVANTPEGANFVLRKDNASLPAATVAPIPIGVERTTWYKVIAGAYTRRSEADSLLSALRAAKVLNDSAGSILEVPLALLVDSVGTQGGIDAAVTAAVRKYTARGLPVYALMQDDGGARLYAGAFDRPNDAGELLKTLRDAGIRPVLAYRTGRTP
ncbi:MAG: hypothetical protein WD802_04625 [Gemmatimonadaceae bacterium]